MQLDFSDGTTARVELLPVENEDYDHYYVHKNDEFCIKNKELCIKNKGFCI